MTLDRILHPQKTFAELTDADIAAWLRARGFGAEQFGLEFKQDFARSGKGRVDFLTFCACLAGLSNGNGGFLVYGISDAVNDPAAAYPSYVIGVPDPRPSLEDLSNWSHDHIRPLLTAVEARLFTVEAKPLWIFRVPNPTPIGF